MRVYKLSMHNQNPPMRDAWEFNNYADLRSSCHNWHEWRTPGIERDVTERITREKLRDFAVFQLGGEFPLVSDRAQQTLMEVCSIREQWLPVNCEEKAYAVLNSRNIIDALDEENSTLRRHNDSAKIRSISRYAFHPERIEHEWVFRTLSYPHTLFYTERFAELYKREMWTGLWLDPVWDSRLEPFPDRPTRKDILARPEVYGPNGIVRGLEHAWPNDWRNQTTNRPV